MSLKDLTDGDFKFYKEYAGKMVDCWEREFIRALDPDLIRSFYRGKNKKENEDYKNDFRNPVSRREHFITYSRIFQATNTILPNLYYQNPRVVATPLKNTSEASAGLMTAVQNHYMKELHQKEENQEAILNAWFFGTGWKKLGYQTVFMPRTPDEPENDMNVPGLLDTVKQGINSILGVQPENLQSGERLDFVDYEGPFNRSESPLNIMLDHKANLRNAKAKLHKLKRTLYELENSGSGYDENELKAIFEKLSKKSGTRLESREIDLNLNELHITQRNGVWVLSWIDEHNKPLKYERAMMGDAFEPIVFTNEPGVRYPTSHMKVATQIQETQDYLATLFVRIIDKVRNQLLINEKDLAPGQIQALERNKLGGIIRTNKPITQSTYAQLTSQSVQNDLPLLMNMLQQNITEVLGTDEQIVAGNSKNKTLGQDKLANVGTQIRESGMLDKVRDWMIRQARKEGALIKTYSNGQLHFQITGRDFKDPRTGQPIENEWVSFMTPENPLGLKHYLQGEFDYDMNIYEAIKPDSQNMRQGYIELIQTASNPLAQDSLLQDGKRIRMGKLFEKTFETYDNLGNTDEFMEDLTSQQVAAIQAQQALKAAAPGILQKGNQQPQPAQAPQGQPAMAGQNG